MAAEAGHPAFDRFVSTVASLRDPENGCPWNRAQSHASLGDYLIEEAYEALDAIEEGDPAHLREELGDVLLQVVLHAQIAAETDEFTIDDVCATIDEKMVRRHPHVFGDAVARDESEVAQLWEQVKLAERANAGDSTNSSKGKHLLDDIPTHFPALLQAQKISRKAVAVGFEWETLDDVWEKVAEERAELEEAYSKEPGSPEAEMEFGDLLFSLVNVARKMGIDAESALRASNAKFRRRFAAIENAAREQGRDIADLTLDEMEELWQQAKIIKGDSPFL